MISIDIAQPACILSGGCIQSQRNGKITVGIQLQGICQQRFVSIPPITHSRTPASHGISQRHLLHCHTVKCLDVSFQHYFIAQPVSLRNRGKVYFKSRTFILFHPERHGRLRVSGLYAEHSVQTSGRKYKLSTKRAEIIGSHLLGSKFLTIYIPKDQFIINPFQHTGTILILLIGNSFYINSLAGTIKRTVRQ